MTATATGVDVSTWQHPDGKPIDWEEVARSGRTFAVVKVTQGVDYVNPWALRDLDEARAAGLLVGAYHYYTSGVDAGGQAQHMVGALIGQHLDLGVWLDWEPPEGDQWTAAGAVTAFLEAARDGRPGCGLYCDESWWGVLKAANVTPPKLWLAAPAAPGAPVGATLWQSGTGMVPGIPTEVDVNVLVSTRGINRPTCPTSRPAGATTVPVHLPASPTEDEDEQDSAAGSTRAEPSLSAP